MKQNLTRREFVKNTALGLVALGLLPYESVFAAGATDADLVVYGKIFTSEGNQLVEALAVKDGKFVYAGDRQGVEAFIKKGRTEVVDYRGKGLVMPGCGNGHAHYMLGYALSTVGTMVDMNDDAHKFMTEILPATVSKARKNGSKVVFGQGWNLDSFKPHIPTRQEIDAVCSDIPVYFLDDECHKAITNTLMLVQAGIMKPDGTVLKREIRGGVIEIGADGTPTGFLSEQAQTYVRQFMDHESLYPVEMALSNLVDIEQRMLSEGYTMYHEGWGNYFVNNNYYKALRQLDQAGKLNFVVGLPYEIESWMDMDEALGRAVAAKQFASKRVHPRWIKLLLDGTVESGTGLIDPLYLDGHQGIGNWDEKDLTEITRKANALGLTVHIHVMGNVGVNTVVNAFVNGGRDEMRNILVHVRNVDEADYKRMAAHNIYATSGITWHHFSDEMQEELPKTLPASMATKAYPLKSFFDYGIPASIHSDYPALSGSPDDPFGIMEIAVTGTYHLEKGKPIWTEELVTREQALTAMTINCAKQMFIENERGSIRPGKFADFLLVDRDVLTCPVAEIHEAKPAATYFEGRKVFSR